MHRVATNFMALLVPLVLLPGSTVAQTSADFPRDAIAEVTGRLNIRSGLLFTTHRTAARVDSETLGQGTLVDVERELGLDGWTRDLRLDAALVLGRRHQIQAGYLSLSRSGSVALQRQIRWGESVFSVDVEVESAVEVTLVPASYRFSLIRTDRFDLGVSAGVFALWLDASVAAPAASVAEAGSAEFPLPVLGADGILALTPRLFVTGGLKYFAVEIEDIDGSWREYRASIEFYPLTHAGVGAGYRFIRLEADGTGGIYSRPEGTLLFLDYRFRGPHLYVILSL